MMCKLIVAIIIIINVYDPESVNSHINISIEKQELKIEVQKINNNVEDLRNDTFWYSETFDFEPTLNKIY